MNDIEARITEALGRHRVERGMRINSTERVEWWECLGCGWVYYLPLHSPDAEAVKRGHIAAAITEELGLKEQSGAPELPGPGYRRFVTDWELSQQVSYAQSSSLIAAAELDSGDGKELGK